MAQEIGNEQIRSVVEELRKIPVFSDLPEDQLVWLAQRFEEVRLDPGQVYAREGDPIDHLAVILEGEIRLQRNDIPDGPSFTAVAGQVTGLLPFSRLTKYVGTGRAVLPTRALRLHKDHFPELLQRMPELGQRLVALMSDRIRETTRLETQHDKLMALGKLSAGLAHELNNPAAAARARTPAACSRRSRRCATRACGFCSIRSPCTTGSHRSFRARGRAERALHLTQSAGAQRSRGSHHGMARGARVPGGMENRSGAGGVVCRNLPGWRRWLRRSVRPSSARRS